MDPRIHIARQAETYEYERSKSLWVGRRGALVVSHGKGRYHNNVWQTVELVSRDGVRYVSVHPGFYRMQMTRMDSGLRALRILADGYDELTYPSRATFKSLERGRIYAHGVNVLVLRPDHLKGCIGVGLAVDGNGVRASIKAMYEIYEALGGFAEGRLFELELAA